MDSLNLNLIDGMMPQVRSETTTSGNHLSEAQREQFAHDFEGILVEKLLEEMKNSIGSWGFEQDAASKQVQGLFWMHLAQDISAKGGFGLWREIEQSLSKMNMNSDVAEKLDEIL